MRPIDVSIASVDNNTSSKDVDAQSDPVFNFEDTFANILPPGFSYATAESRTAENDPEDKGEEGAEAKNASKDGDEDALEGQQRTYESLKIVESLVATENRRPTRIGTIFAFLEWSLPGVSDVPQCKCLILKDLVRMATTRHHY